MVNHLKAIPLIFNKRPVYYLLHVTGKCNASCSHCFYWQDIRDGKVEDDLTLDEYKKLSASMGELLVVNLCGAEAYLRSDLCEIAGLFAQNNRCRLMTIPSNGFLTDRIVEYCERLCRENPDTFFRFAFSLDGPRELHDKIRGVEGLFDRCIQTIQKVSELKSKHQNFVILTSTVFSRETQNEIISFLDWLKSNLPVEQTNVTFVRGNPLDASTLDVSPEKYQEVVQKVKQDARLELKDKKIESILPYSMFLNTMETIDLANQNKNQRVFHCYAGEKFVVVGRKGDVHPCEILDDSKSLGNLKDFDWNIQKLLESKKAREVVGWVNEEHCACTWECAIQASKLFDAKQWPVVAKKSIEVALTT